MRIHHKFFIILLTNKQTNIAHNIIPTTYGDGNYNNCAS